MGKTIRKTDDDWQRKREQKEKSTEKSNSKKKFFLEKTERNDREKYTDR